MVLLFHGYSASRDQVEPVAAVFRQLGWATITVDFRGHGHSPGNTTTLGWREAEDVRAVFEAQDARPIGLYGFSMGAAAMHRAAQDLEGVDFLVSEACFGRMEDTVRVRFDAMGLPSSPGTELLLFWGGVLADIDAGAHNPVEYAANVQAPLLVVQGDEDLRVTLETARALGGELVVLEGVGHELGAVAAPERFRAGLDGFLQERLGER
ncbi:MAG TPA: alpha/beta fold hydrolase [Myxococcota bacterium]|nr:alpha/beta fold hydrolase [Myxococcota bacterium]